MLLAGLLEALDEAGLLDELEDAGLLDALLAGLLEDAALLEEDVLPELLAGLLDELDELLEEDELLAGLPEVLEELPGLLGLLPPQAVRTETAMTAARAVAAIRLLNLIINLHFFANAPIAFDGRLHFTPPPYRFVNGFGEFRHFSKKEVDF